MLSDPHKTIETVISTCRPCALNATRGKTFLDIADKEMHSTIEVYLNFRIRASIFRKDIDQRFCRLMVTLELKAL